MFRSVSIEGYRGFARYQMHDLGRVNLLVGRNNSGKTTVLEALYLLGTAGDPVGLWDNCVRRGEIFRDPRLPESRLEADVSHLFHGHDLTAASYISVTPDAHEAEGLSISVNERVPRPRDEDFAVEATEAPPGGSRLSLSIRAANAGRMVNLSARGGLEFDMAVMFSQMARPREAKSIRLVQFVSTQGVSTADLVRLWDEVQLAGDESLVVAMLKAIDPAIEDIRSLASAATAGPREGFVVRCANESRRLPLGSLGDGVWRMLTLAVVLARCKGGMLLVDEIDTGLHHTVMADMWRLVYDAAERLDIQVFATTHSEDCVYSLASICRDDENASDVTVQRIEAGRAKSVAYSETEIRAAAEHRIEVR